MIPLIQRTMALQRGERAVESEWESEVNGCTLHSIGTSTTVQLHGRIYR